MQRNRFIPPLPEWTSLRCAVGWLAVGQPLISVDDETRLSEKKPVEGEEYAAARDNLLLALRHSRISAQGVVYLYRGDHLMFSDHPEHIFYVKGWEEFLAMLLEDESFAVSGSDEYLSCCGWWPVLPMLWDHFAMEWDGGCLYSVRDPSLSGKISNLRINVADLVRTFTENKGESGDQYGAEQPQRKWGRPREYDWDSFYVEIGVRADFDGLPTAQADLEKQMASWCENAWGKQPTESAIREKIAPIYRHPRRARKADK